MKTTVMNAQIFPFDKYDLKGHLSFLEFKKILHNTSFINRF